MFRILVLVLNIALILLTAAQDVPTTDHELIFEDLVLNGTISGERANFRSFIKTEPYGKLYAIGNYVTVNWIGAQEMCSLHGLTLATINSYEDKERLRRHLRSYGYENYSFWIAGSNLGQRKQWVWLSSGQLITYGGWAYGQPDNQSGDENCMEIMPGVVWNDSSCDKEQYFICENRCAV